MLQINLQQDLWGKSRQPKICYWKYFYLLAALRRLDNTVRGKSVGICRSVLVLPSCVCPVIAVCLNPNDPHVSHLHLVCLLLYLNASLCRSCARQPTFILVFFLVFGFASCWVFIYFLFFLGYSTDSVCSGLVGLLGQPLLVLNLVNKGWNVPIVTSAFPIALWRAQI